ncbi:F-box/kelch-repeat protein [Cardamine amara subsp. amara]|uniref:F-box/kelch-repeat protein n=1 Tax=Cardamine amara subsp. amara TaxID=228776 RepID=A0ABD0Z2W5_CARAN
MSSRARSASAKSGPSDKKRKTNPSPAIEVIEPTSVLSLPKDLLLNCLARISRLHYPTLSLVSKTFRSIIASPELYETRSRLNRTEKCLYLVLHFPFDTKTYCFTLYRQPNRKVTNESSGYLMVEIPSPYPGMVPAQRSTLVAVGSNIYKIGGSDSCGFQLFGSSSSFVSFLNCQSHTWHQTRSMQMDRSCSSTASLVDGKIYVAGGNKKDRSSNWVEVFDPKSQTWESVPNPRMQLYEWNEYAPRRVPKSISLEGKFYLFGDEFKVYNSEEGKWNYIEEGSLMHHAVGTNSSYCVIDDVLFVWHKYNGKFKWYDLKLNLWKELCGIEGLPDFEECKMVDLGGKMAVLWDVLDHTARYQENRIWCAEISLEKRDGGEIWGKVEWLDFVLRVHGSCTLSHTDVISASL